MNKSFFAIIVTLLFVPAVFAQKPVVPKLPSFVRGSWVIARYTDLGGAHAAAKPDIARAQIGKKVSFGEEFSHDKDFLWFDDECPNFAYVREKHGLGGAVKGTMLFYDLKEAWDDGVDYVIVSCSGQKYYYFEITRDKDLGIYYDNWFFFLKKQL